MIAQIVKKINRRQNGSRRYITGFALFLSSDTMKKHSSRVLIKKDNKLY
jgi:hypothetical protein